MTEKTPLFPGFLNKKEAMRNKDRMEEEDARRKRAANYQLLTLDKISPADQKTLADIGIDSQSLINFMNDEIEKKKLKNERVVTSPAIVLNIAANFNMELSKKIETDNQAAVLHSIIKNIYFENDFATLEELTQPEKNTTLPREYIPPRRAERGIYVDD